MPNNLYHHAGCAHGQNWEGIYSLYQEESCSKWCIIIMIYYYPLSCAGYICCSAYNRLQMSTFVVEQASCLVLHIYVLKIKKKERNCVCCTFWISHCTESLDRACFHTRLDSHHIMWKLQGECGGRQGMIVM